MVALTPAATVFGHEDFAGLLDDAAVFPPGNSPVEAAVATHLVRRERAGGVLIGPLVVTPAHLDAVRSSLDETGATVGPLAVSIVIRDLGALAAATRAVRGDGRLVLAAVELAVPDHEGTAAALDAAAGLGSDVPVWVEPGWGPMLGAAIGLLHETGHGLKLRTGGTTAEAFPDEATLAAAVAGAVAHGVRFKATAGLHHALRHTNSTTGFEHHGFANLLLAAHAADDGVQAAGAWLSCREPRSVAAALAALGPDGLASVRRDRFVSFGTCDVDDPRHDLQTLGLLPREQAHPHTKDLPA